MTPPPPHSRRDGRLGSSYGGWTAVGDGDGDQDGEAHGVVRASQSYAPPRGSQTTPRRRSSTSGGGAPSSSPRHAGKGAKKHSFSGLAALTRSDRQAHLRAVLDSAAPSPSSAASAAAAAAPCATDAGMDTDISRTNTGSGALGAVTGVEAYMSLPVERGPGDADHDAADESARVARAATIVPAPVSATMLALSGANSGGGSGGGGAGDVGGGGGDADSNDDEVEFDSGYDLSLCLEPMNSKIVQEISCVLCKKLCRDAMGTGVCDHVYCEKCIEKWMARHQDCPACHKALPMHLLVPCKLLRERLDAIRVRCPGDACGKELLLGELHRHSKFACVARKVHCPICQSPMLALELARHMADSVEDHLEFVLAKNDDLRANEVHLKDRSRELECEKEDLNREIMEQRETIRRTQLCMERLHQLYAYEIKQNRHLMQIIRNTPEYRFQSRIPNSESARQHRRSQRSPASVSADRGGRRRRQHRAPLSEQSTRTRGAHARSQSDYHHIHPTQHDLRHDADAMDSLDDLVQDSKRTLHQRARGQRHSGGCVDDDYDGGARNGSTFSSDEEYADVVGNDDDDGDEGYDDNEDDYDYDYDEERSFGLSASQSAEVLTALSTSYSAAERYRHYQQAKDPSEISKDSPFRVSASVPPEQPDIVPAASPNVRKKLDFGDGSNISSSSNNNNNTGGSGDGGTTTASATMQSDPVRGDGTSASGNSSKTTKKHRKKKAKTSRKNKDGKHKNKGKSKLDENDRLSTATTASAASTEQQHGRSAPATDEESMVAALDASLDAAASAAMTTSGRSPFQILFGGYHDQVDRPEQRVFEPEEVYFSVQHKHKLLRLSTDRLSVTNQVGFSAKSVGMEETWSAGTHCFAISLAGCTEGAIVGVVPESKVVWKQGGFLGYRHPGWVLNTATGKICSGAKDMKGERDYASMPFTSDDVVGVRVNLDEGTLEFLRNGQTLGIAFADVRGVPIRGAVTVSALGDSVTIIHTDKPKEETQWF